MIAIAANPGERPAAATASDEELLRTFEDCSLDAATFTHRCHLRVAWLYLRRHGFPEGAVRFRERLKAYVAAVGAAAKYHETITWAYLVLMNEEMSLRSAPQETFEEMLLRRPDLLDHRHGAIARCYTRAQLDDPAARCVFILPARTHASLEEAKGCAKQAAAGSTMPDR